MRSNRAIVIALALAIGAAIPVAAQDGWHGDGGRDQDAYGAGSGWHDRDYGRDQYQCAVERARQIGFQDGVNDGARDRETGRSFRPTHDKNYKHGDRGFENSFGSKDRYKDLYRQSYLSGYDRGYNGQRRDRDGDYDRR